MSSQVDPKPPPATLTTSPPTVPIQSDNVEQHNIISQTLSLLYTTGFYFGVRLLRPHVPHEWRIARALRFVMFGWICLHFLVAIIVCLCLAFPQADHRALKLTLDVYSIYPFLWLLFAFDSFNCFVLLNFSMNYFINKQNFKGRLLENSMLAQLPTKTCVTWRRTTEYLLLLVAFLIVFQFCLAGSMIGGLVEAPVRMDRVEYWIGIPQWLGWVVLSVLLILGPIHIAYHCVFMATQCDLVRLLFRAYNERVAKESSANFTSKQIILHQTEYYRLTGLVHYLDGAFRYPCFSQLAVVAIATCFVLYLFAAGNAPLGPLCYVTLTLGGLICIFAFSAIPALMLDGQVTKPKSIFRAWLVRYELTCLEQEEKPDEGAQNTLMAFIQCVYSTDVGITVASITKLNGSLLITLCSLIITYFLVILQFGIDNHPKSIDLMNSTMEILSSLAHACKNKTSYDESLCKAASTILC